MLRNELWDVAVDQYGFVVTADARALGAGSGELARLHRRGMLDRAGHGVYRFPQWPVTSRDDYMLAILWANTPQAALSHDTALAAYDLCEINPEHIHLTIPLTRRINRAGGQGYVLHRENLSENQLSWWEGIPTVTEYTAISQGITSGIPVHLLLTALDTARRRGRITTEQHANLRTEMSHHYAL